MFVGHCVPTGLHTANVSSNQYLFLAVIYGEFELKRAEELGAELRCFLHTVTTCSVLRVISRHIYLLTKKCGKCKHRFCVLGAFVSAYLWLY